MITSFDSTVYSALSGLNIPWLNPVMVFVSTISDNGLVWIIVGIILMFFKKTRKIGITTLCALLFSALFCNLVLKNLVGRARPFAEIKGFIALIPLPTDSSFPSGHTSASFAAAVALSYYLKKGAPFFIGLAALTGFSRIYLGVHYPTDVLGGFVLGIICAVLAVLLVKSLSKNGKLYNAFAKKNFFNSSKNRE